MAAEVFCSIKSILCEGYCVANGKCQMHVDCQHQTATDPDDHFLNDPLEDTNPKSIEQMIAAEDMVVATQ